MWANLVHELGREEGTTMDALQALKAQRAYVDELLHRITVAESRAIRVQLCAETKREIGTLESMLTALASGTQQ